MIIILLAAGAALLLGLIHYLYKKYWNKGLSVTLDFSEKSVIAGEHCYLEEVVTNDKILPLPVLKVKFQVSRNLLFLDRENSGVTDQYYRNDVLSVLPYAIHRRKFEFICGNRGYYTIHGLDLVAGDLFLSTELMESKSADAVLYGYPRPLLDDRFLNTLQKISGEVLSKRHLIEDPFEYRGIRDYYPGDEMKSINWKATAKTDDLKVNQRNYTSMKAVRIFINLEEGVIIRRVDLHELSISAAVGAASYFLNQGIRVSMYGNGPDLLTGQLLKLSPGAGAGFMDNMNKALARIDLTDPAPPFYETMEESLFQSGDDIYTIIIGADVRDDFQAVLCRLKEEHRDFLWICPLYEDAECEIRLQLQDVFLRLNAKEILSET